MHPSGSSWFRGALLMLVVISIAGGQGGCLPSLFFPDPDQDRDGFEEGEDCNDFNDAIHPGAEEVPYNGLDDDCMDGDLIDVDRDGVASFMAAGQDCDDLDPLVYPGASEICDGKPNRCDGFVDDQDRDGQPSTDCQGSDCNDTDATIQFGALEIPYDGIDQDCDGGDLKDVDGDGHIAVEAGGTDCNDRLSDLENSAEIFIPAGRFVMGTSSSDPYSDESPQHEVYLSGYCIDSHEVTTREYRSCANLESDEGGCPPPDAIFVPENYYASADYDLYPMVNVTWDMAVAFCRSVGKTLPTEAQWEKAARGGLCLDGDAGCAEPNLTPTRTYPWGEDEPTCGLANFGAPCVEETPQSRPVADYVAGRSPSGILNMAGNVSEWVNDYYSDTYYENVDEYMDPAGPSSGFKRIFRGGSFAESIAGIRSAKRSANAPSSYDYTLGFRCARSLSLSAEVP